jgi:N-carbamoylputrescine amidase
MFMLYSNIVGNDNNIVFWGGAQVYGPRGGLVAAADPFEAENLKVEIDLDELPIARHARPTLRDTRPEIFEIILREYDSDYGL